MAHYAYLNENNIVTQVIVGKDEGIDGVNWEEYYGAKRTSYNTRGNVYYTPGTDIPDSDQTQAFRKNFAGVGYTYDVGLDAFIPPKTFPSWILDTYTGLWIPPFPAPNDGNSYYWDETTHSWVLMNEH